MSGHASHKGSSAKPNNNQNGLIDPDPIGVPTEADYSRNDQDVTPVNAAATERPKEQSEVEQK
ncbi:MAG: hypothetical protein LH660_11570 [Phormidesmis sp. CAN_BIN36]|nr:hypothetical protein [Phormidesmis sp. CAN_BIN36]